MGEKKKNGKIKVKDLLELFENGKYSNPDSLTIISDLTNITLMECKFKSWNNIDRLILDLKVNGCNVTGDRYIKTLIINTGELS